MSTVACIWDRDILITVYYIEMVSFHVFGTILMCYETVILKLGYATFA